MRSNRLAAILPLVLLVRVLSWASPPATPAPAWPPAPAPARISFLRVFAQPDDLGLGARGLGALLHRLFSGREDQQLSRPYGIAVTPDGARIAVTDPGRCAVAVYDLAAHGSRWITKVGGRKLQSPIGAAFDDRGRLYVSDSERGEVMAFDASYRPAFTLGAADGLKRPTGIAVRADRLYVVDTATHQVEVFRLGDSGASRLLAFGNRGADPGTFNYPVDIAVSISGEVFVNDSMNFRVECFAADGTYLRSFGSAGDGSGHFQRPKGVAVDSDGNLYVADALADAVEIFDPATRFLLDFGETGSAVGEFWLPAGLAIDGSDTIYVADSWNHRIQMFRYHGGGK